MNKSFYKIANVRFFDNNGEKYVHLEDLKNYLLALEPKYKKRISVTAIANECGMSAVRLNRYLCEKGVQYKRGRTWHIKSSYKKKDYVTSVSGANKKSHMYWTSKGKEFIMKLLEEDGIINNNNK